MNHEHYINKSDWLDYVKRVMPGAVVTKHMSQIMVETRAAKTLGVWQIESNCGYINEYRSPARLASQ